MTNLLLGCGNIIEKIFAMIYSGVNIMWRRSEPHLCTVHFLVFKNNCKMFVYFFLIAKTNSIKIL